MNTCSKCNRPIDDGIKFCTECGTAVSGCPKCGQPIVDGIKFCTECGASVLAPKKPNERMGLSLPSAPIEKPTLFVNNNASTSPTIDLHFSAFEAEVKKPINKNRILVIVMLLSGVLGFAFLGVAVFRASKGSDTVSQSNAATPAPSSPTASQPTAIQADTQMTSQPQTANPASQPSTVTATPEQDSQTELATPAVQAPTQVTSQRQSSDSLPVQITNNLAQPIPDQHTAADAPVGCNGCINISAGVAVGRLVQKSVPIYPPIAMASRVSGTVVLMATISTTGEVENLHVVSGPAMLQQAALDAVKTWRYRPYLLNNEPVPVVTTINVIFNLGE